MSLKQTYLKNKIKKVFSHLQNACDEASVCVYILLTIQLDTPDQNGNRPYNAGQGRP